MADTPGTDCVDHGLPEACRGEWEGKAQLLRSALAAAVPLWATRVRAWSEGERRRRRRHCAQAIAEHGDLILFKGKGTADAFNHLAEGLALLSFAPGGVRLLGLHWTSTEASGEHTG